MLRTRDVLAPVGAIAVGVTLIALGTAGRATATEDRPVRSALRVAADGRYLVRTDGTAELSHELAADIDAGQLIVNLRAEADPAALKDATVESIEALAQKVEGLTLEVQHLEHFRPGKPEPTHRLAEA